MTAPVSRLFVVDNSALARVRLHSSVRAVVQRWILSTLGGQRSLLVQRCEIGVGARTEADHERMIADLERAAPLLDSDTDEVRAAAISLQRSLVRRGTHRGPGVVDLLIAATALVHDAAVLHYDSDFDLLAAAEPRLRAHWVVPRGSLP